MSGLESAASLQHRRTMSVIARDIPDRKRFAMAMPLHIRTALQQAWRGPHGWRVGARFVDEMRAYGLVEYGGPHLMVFGMQVRQALIEKAL